MDREGARLDGATAATPHELPPAPPAPRPSDPSSTESGSTPPGPPPFAPPAFGPPTFGPPAFGPPAFAPPTFGPPAGVPPARGYAYPTPGYPAAAYPMPGYPAPGPYGPPGAVPPDPPTAAVLDLPLGTRGLVRQSLDLLTRRDAGLRGPSFYIGFLMLATVGPPVVTGWLALTVADVFTPFAASRIDAETSAWFSWLLLAMIPGFLGYIAAGVEADTLATAVLGARVEGRPLRLPESIAIARHRFWRMLGARILVGLLTGIVGFIVQLVVTFTIGPVEPVTFATSLLVSLFVGAPFVYVPAAIVLGEVDVTEAIARSWRLARMRRALALVVSCFGVLSQFIVLFGLSTGLDAVARVLTGAGLVEDVPRPAIVPLGAALTFAVGTLVFLVTAIAAAPAVHAFEALTHYTNGLQVGRRAPVRLRHAWDPWVTPGLALAALLGLLVLLGAVASVPPPVP